MISAYVFQNKFSGVQIFVYHSANEIQAKQKFYEDVIEIEDWVYIGKKSVIN